MACVAHPQIIIRKKALSLCKKLAEKEVSIKKLLLEIEKKEEEIGNSEKYTAMVRIGLFSITSKNNIK